MAVMIPDYIHRDCKSDAEKKLFFRFRDELSDEHVILHSLALARHQKKLRSEIDFVILGKRGVLCLEVKGGGVESEKGVWYFKDRYGETHARRESPFDQASSNMHAVKRSVEKQFGKKSVQSQIIFGYIVVFPDIRFERQSPEWDLNRVIDQKKLSAEIEAIIKWQFDYSEQEISRVTRGLAPKVMSDSELQRLVQFLRGDFHFVPSLSSEIENTYLELLRLTEEQYDILDQFAENPRIVVYGDAGTGKTVLAIEKARRDARNGMRVFYVCFNRLLAKKIKHIIKNEGLEDAIEVSTLHAYAKKMIDSAGFSLRSKNSEKNELYRKKYPELFAEAFVKIMKEAPFDSLVVDEGQDLRNEVYADMLDWVLRGGLSTGTWIWMEDSKQNIFNPKKEIQADLKQYGPVYCRLTKNCRNTQPISTFTSFITRTELQKCLVEEGPIVEQIFYRDRSHQLRELKKILKNLLGHGIKREDIVLLSPITIGQSIINEMGRIGETKLLPYEVDSPAKNALRYCTIQSFKGLESKAIIVTDVNDLYSDYSRSIYYVGLSRAMSWLAVLINENIKEQFLDLARRFGTKLVKVVRGT